MNRNKPAGFAALACVVMLALLSIKPDFTNASRPPRGIANPVVAMEVARNVQEVDAILSDAPSPDREVMRIKQYIDFGFIASYAAFYIALARFFGTRAAVVAAVLGVIAAVLDVIENIGILQILDVPLTATSQAMIDAIRYPSLAKWTLAFGAAALFGALFWNRGRWTMRVVGALNLAAAALGFYGLFDNAFLVWAGLPLFASVLVAAPVLLLPRRKG